jgi:NADH:ubiquinone oxidoreductase subunit E
MAKTAEHDQEAQAKEGWVSEEAMTQISQDLKLPLGEVFGVTTFYSFLSTKPWGVM